MGETGVRSLARANQGPKGRHIDAVIIGEIGMSLVLAAVFGLARASTVRLSYREGQ